MTSFTMKEGGFLVSDYVVFLILCISSCTGGLYYSAVGSKKKTVKDIKDYLLGGKSMSTFPVAMSLIASYVSGVTILGTPAEIYNYGSQYWLVVVGVCLSCACVATVYLPVFCTLRLSSSYEYLELRFNRHVRAVASILFLIDEILFLPMVVYVPALAFNQLTGFNVLAVGGIMVLICGLYTVLGGLRAVVWTDTVQTIVMFAGVVTVAIAGTVALGGISAIMDIANQSQRLDLSNWSFDPLERQTGWGALVGGFLYWTCFNSVNQTMVQRYIALPTKKKTIKALMIFCCGAVFAISACVWCGLAAWAAWVTGGCDPGGVPLVDDRLLPAFVTYVSRTQRLPGLPGIFLAGVFGAGLSSLSCVLNACALVVVEDLLRGWLRLRLKPFKEGLIARGVSGILAVMSIVMLVVIEKLGGVLGVATALSAIAASATCGIFTLGMACWWVGPRGAIAGGIAGAIVAGTISIGTQTAAAKGYRWPPLNMTEQCAKNASYVSMIDTIDPSEIFPLFRISYHWIAPLGLLATLVVGSCVGYWCDSETAKIHDPSEIFPLFRISYHWIAPLGLAATLVVGSCVGYWCDSEGAVPMDAELFTPVVRRWLPRAAHRDAGAMRRARLALEPPATPLILGIINKEIPESTTN